MKMHAWVVAATLWVSLGVPAQAQPRVEYLTQEPPKGSLPHRKVVYVDDRSCPKGEVKEITGGSERQSIPRKVRCVKRPG